MHNFLNIRSIHRHLLFFFSAPVFTATAAAAADWNSETDTSGWDPARDFGNHPLWRLALQPHDARARESRHE